MTAIYKRELKSYFITPMGFVFLTIFLFILGTTFVFNNIYSNIADMQAFLLGYHAAVPDHLHRDSDHAHYDGGQEKPH